jgi:hypothetical protein
MITVKTCSNIFQIGCVMNFLILGKQTDLNAKGLKLGKVQFPEDIEYGSRKPMLCHSQGLNDPDITEHYSRALLDMVKKCMLREPEDRPKAPGLVKMVRRYRDHALKTAGERQAPPPGDLGKVRMAGMNPPEPPDEWLYEIPVNQDSDLTEWDANMDEMEKARREFRETTSEQFQPTLAEKVLVGALKMAVGRSSPSASPLVMSYGSSPPEDSENRPTPGVESTVGNAALNALKSMTGHKGSSG